MIFVTGDMHGDVKLFSQPKFKNIKAGDTLIICGDFGFIWYGDKAEKKILDKLSKKKYNICFIDGSLENFELLSAYPQGTWCGGKVHKIADNIFHLMRGQIFEIEGQRIFTMGGGESPDIDMRFENDTWSKLEIPSKEEMVEGAQNLENAGLEVDIIITHEPSQTIKGFLKLKETQEVRLTALNAYFEELGKSCKFKRWFFGCLHEDKFVSSSNIAVYRNLIDAATGELVR